MLCDQHSVQIRLEMSGLTYMPKISTTIYVGWWCCLKVKCCVLVNDYHISKTPVVELPTVLFSSNTELFNTFIKHIHDSVDVHVILILDLQGLLFNISAFTSHYIFELLWQQWNFIKWIFRFILFNLSIDDLHKSISLFWIEFKRMELRLCIVMHLWTIVYWN